MNSGFFILFGAIYAIMLAGAAAAVGGVLRFLYRD